MLAGSLERLVDTARALPGERRPARPVQLPSAQVPLAADAEAVDAPALRRRLGSFLGELASRLEQALTSALQHAAVAWDTFDEVHVLDATLRGDAAWIAGAASALERAADPAQRAIGMEVRIALTSTLGLVHLVERRLASLVRLRVQSGDATLLPGERPFLDVAAALAEAARGWA
jgi:hypothetical protein